MSEKKYFWLKLKDDFFAQKEIKKLRRIAGGDTFTIIYLKMQLLSLKNEGKLIFEGIEETLHQELALMLDEKTENVHMTLLYLQKHKLIEELNCEEYLLPKVCDNIGREGSSAERVRRHREKIKALHCNGHVTKNVTCNTEIEIDKDMRLDTYNRSVNNDGLKNQSVSQSERVATVMGKDRDGEEGGRTDGRTDDSTLAKIFKVAEVDNYPEPTAMFIKQVITSLWTDGGMKTKIRMSLTYEQIRDRLRLCRAKHIEAAFVRMKKCRTNKEIYFAKCLLSAIVEKGIEEIFEEEGGLE